MSTVSPSPSQLAVIFAEPVQRAVHLAARVKPAARGIVLRRNVDRLIRSGLVVRRMGFLVLRMRIVVMGISVLRGFVGRRIGVDRLSSVVL